MPDASDMNNPLRGLTNSKTEVANRVPAEPLLELAEDVDLGDLLELVMERWLKDTNIKHALAQRDGRGVRGDEIADDFAPGLEHFGLMQSLFQPKPLH